MSPADSQFAGSCLVRKGWTVADEHVVGYDGMWAKPEDDPRAAGKPVGELATIREYLSNYRLTLGMKCEDLSPEQLATRSVPPSTLSLLGLIRHMARVEHNWFQRSLKGHRDLPRLFWSPDDYDLDFNGAVADQAVVDEAFAAWKHRSPPPTGGSTGKSTWTPWSSRRAEIRRPACETSSST